MSARTPSMDDKATASPPGRTVAAYEADKAAGINPAGHPIDARSIAEQPAKEEPMSEVLRQARSLAGKSAAETKVWVPLDVLQGLIAEIDKLQAERPLKAVKQAAESRAA